MRVSMPYFFIVNILPLPPDVCAEKGESKHSLLFEGQLHLGLDDSMIVKRKASFVFRFSRRRNVFFLRTSE